MKTYILTCKQAVSLLTETWTHITCYLKNDVIRNKTEFMMAFIIISPFLTFRSPPARLMEQIEKSSSVLTMLLCDTPIDTCQPITARSDVYHYTLNYLLTWKLIMKFFKSAPSEVNGFLLLHVFSDLQIKQNM